MEITHEVLLSLGFVEIPNRPELYHYKGIIGRLKFGWFLFHGFGMEITTLANLKFMLMLIDYPEETTVKPYPNNFN
jgi:hypothetical protein